MFSIGQDSLLHCENGEEISLVRPIVGLGKKIDPSFRIQETYEESLGNQFIINSPLARNNSQNLH